MRLKNKMIFFIACIAIMLVVNSCENEKADLEKLGYELIKLKYSDERQISGVVNVGDSLYSKIKKSSFDTLNYKIDIKKGDLDVVEDNDAFTKKADYLIIIMSNNNKIGVRVRYDKELEKYHILGYVTG